MAFKRLKNIEKRLSMNPELHGHHSILEGIAKEDLEVQLCFSDNDEGHIKTLGLGWEPKRDCFIFNTTWPEQIKISKRTVLADMAHLFDPLGLVNPVIVLGKIFMQQLWSLKLNWDDDLPYELSCKWVNFRQSLMLLNNLKVGRYILNDPFNTKIELHAFADASEKAYGTAIYIRSITSSGEIITKLLCAKSRVAPVKVVTLPRLELCAAKLATQLVQRIIKSSKIKFNNITYWTDSQITLSWINEQPSSLRTFVANRVQAILEISSPSQWRYVNTKYNPADLVSRGVTAEILINSELWFHGPSFLQKPETEWPCSTFQKIKTPAEEREMKIVLHVNNSQDKNTEEHFLQRINHCNSFIKLQRITALVLRSIKVFKGIIRKEKIPKFVLVSELNEALKVIVKEIQQSSFAADIEGLRKEGQVKSTSRLASLTPFLDEDKLIRVGGRLDASSLPHEAKHQLLLSGEHNFTKLLMSHLHLLHLHAGPQALLYLSRRKFWITQGRNLARSVVTNCVLCARARPQLMNQLMGNLPKGRVLPGRPFLTAGVDFCGPIWTHFRLRGKRPEKSYIAVFCCFVTKAVHLEVVSDLTTEAFLGALKRFVARRGNCKDLYCDNATNFVGANNKLKEVHEMLRNEKSMERITNICAEKQIQFHFIPPRSPHFGGLWESSVKSAKKLLLKALTSASLTFEELSTVVAEIEAILNSRPLTPMSSDPNDYTALTPGHFLIGEPTSSLPDPETEPTKMSALSRWKLVNYIQKEFWRRWTTEYLTELQQRLKWTRQHANIPLGTLVIIKDNNLPPLKWPMGRIIGITPGADGLVRVAEVKTASGTVKRAIHNLCPLPVEPTPQDKETEHEEIKPKNKRRTNEESTSAKRRKSISMTSTLGLLLIALLVFPCCCTAAKPSVNQNIEIKTFDNQPGIYYEKIGDALITSQEWKWIVYYDMKGYWDILQNIQKGINKLEILKTIITKGEYYSEIIRQYKHAVQQFEHTNRVLLTQHGTKQQFRSKRGLINVVGNVAHQLFGLLDENYAKEMSETINKVQGNEEHLQLLLQNQTSVLEATELLIKQTKQERIQQMKSIEATFQDNLDKMQNMTMQMKEQKAIQSFIALATLISILISEYQKIQNTLLDTVTDVHLGRMNYHIMSVEDLEKQLTSMKEHLPSSLKLPSRDVIKLYKLMTVKCNINHEHTIFIVRLPLSTSTEFEAYKVVPLPSMINNSYIYIKSATDMILIDVQRELFYPLSTDNFRNCMVVEVKKFLCHQTQPIYNKNSEVVQCHAQMLNQHKLAKTCTIATSIPSKIWVQSTNPNQWLFALDKEYVYTFICGNTIFQHKLKGNGLLKLKKGCLMKDDHIIINSHNTINEEFGTTFYPAFNISDEISIPNGLISENNVKVTFSVQNHTEELKQLHEKLVAIHQNQGSITQLQPHDIHQYTIGYSALTASIIIGICMTIIFYKLRQAIQNPTPTLKLIHKGKLTEDDFKIEVRDFKVPQDVETHI